MEAPIIWGIKKFEVGKLEDDLLETTEIGRYPIGTK